MLAVRRGSQAFSWRLAIGAILVQLALILLLFGLPLSQAVVQV